MRDYLCRQLELINIDASEKQITSLMTFFNEIEAWNKKINLVRAERFEIVDKHFVDTLLALNEFRSYCKGYKNCRIADVGAGAGFPSIPLAIFMEDCSFYLIERSGKRAAFLSYVVGILGLKNRVFVLNSELKDVSETFDIVTFRAFRQLDEFISEIFSITDENGVIIAYKARRKVIEDDLKNTKKNCSFNFSHKIIDIGNRQKTENKNYDERNLLILKKTN